LAVTQPDLVAGLLLVGTGPHMNRHRDVDGILRRVRLEWGNELRAAVLDRSFATPLDPAEPARMLESSTTVRQQAVHDVLASQRSLDFTSTLNRIAAPTVVLHDELDRARSVVEARELAFGIPGAHLRLVTPGHTQVYKAAADVRELLRCCGPAAAPRTCAIKSTLGAAITHATVCQNIRLNLDSRVWARAQSSQLQPTDASTDITDADGQPHQSDDDGVVMRIGRDLEHFSRVLGAGCRGFAAADAVLIGTLLAGGAR
jgi:hypothetical protein